MGPDKERLYKKSTPKYNILLLLWLMSLVVFSRLGETDPS